MNYCFSNSCNLNKLLKDVLDEIWPELRLRQDEFVAVGSKVSVMFLQLPFEPKRSNDKLTNTLTQLVAHNSHHFIGGSTPEFCTTDTFNDSIGIVRDLLKCYKKDSNGLYASNVSYI